MIRRATQELLSNARRHAPGATVVVSLSNGQETLLRVAAPRVTAPPRSVGGGHGLLGIRERVEALGGRVHIDSGDPFTVTLGVPK